MRLEEYVNSMNEKLKVISNKKHVVLWGAGENTVRIFQYTNIYKYDIEDIVDKGKAGEVFFGKTIKNPKEINWKNVEVVVISAFYKESDIFEELTKSFSFKGIVIRLNEKEQKKPFYHYSSYKDVSKFDDVYKNLLLQNKKFFNIHKGQRLFILCNGPSINKLDLKKLENEIVMAVSNFYMHPDYNIIAPTYYCTPHFTYNDLFTKNVAIDWLYDMECKAGETQYFFNITERELISQNNLFDKKNVNYVHMGIPNIYIDSCDSIDLTEEIIGVQTVPIMCLQIAIYMGFKEIYLIGTEYSDLLPGNSKYDYFYDRSKNIIGDKDSVVKNKGESTLSTTEKLKILHVVWQQFEKMKQLAEEKNIKIYNATIGGILDMFERVNFDDLF